MEIKQISQVVGPSSAAVEGKRSIEQVVGFGFGHRFRVEIRRALHDRPATAAELANILHQPRERLRYHIEELLKDGSIEIAARKPANNNMTQHIYRLNRLSLNSTEDWTAMSEVDRQVESALILQGTWTEALAALMDGYFHRDPNVVNVWNRILLDKRGRKDFHDELESTWDRIEKVEVEAASRRIDSKEPGQRFIAAVFGYRRVRNSAPAPQPSEIGQCEDDPLLDDSVPSSRTVEEAIGRAVTHRIRVEILAALHEGPATAASLSRTLAQPPGDLHYHLRQLLEDRAIRIVDRLQKGNLAQAVYAYVRLPIYDHDDWSSLSAHERQVISAVTLRAGMAESLAAMWAGRLHSDPRLILTWKPIVLDGEGREALTQEQRRAWNRVCEIEAEAARRLRAAPERGEMHIFTLLGFQRSQTRGGNL
jgi:DNA-binding transcriptional ArsR family regulator